MPAGDAEPAVAGEVGDVGASVNDDVKSPATTPDEAMTPEAVRMTSTRESEPSGACPKRESRSGPGAVAHVGGGCRPLRSVT